MTRSCKDAKGSRGALCPLARKLGTFTLLCSPVSFPCRRGLSQEPALHDFTIRLVPYIGRKWGALGGPLGQAVSASAPLRTHATQKGPCPQIGGPVQTHIPPKQGQT